MIGRAGRPQFDDSGVAMVYVQDIKKNFYKKFLYEPFPVESRFDIIVERKSGDICKFERSVGGKLNLQIAF
jgi:replicative superfamily II helicase